MNILIVTAHPSPTSLTKAIATTYGDARRAKGHVVDTIDLYSKEYEVPLLAFTSIREFVPTDIQKKFHERLGWAEEIVVVHPIWWGTTPALMKNWVDLTFWPRVAYRYTQTGAVEKMLKGKKAKIFATCGGPSWYHHFIFMPLLSFWELCVFGFCGAEVTDVKICGHMDVYKDEKKKKHIEKFLESIKKSA